MSNVTGPDRLLLPGPRAELLRRLGTLTIEDLHGLDAAVRALGEEKPYRKRVDKGFWLAWYKGPRLTKAAEGELGRLFVAVVVAIAGAVTGLDVERLGGHLRSGRQDGVFGDLMHMMRPDSSNLNLQHAAIGLIEDAVAPWDPRLAILASWNVACAATLRTYLPVEIVAVLEGAWRHALGEPPA